MKSNKPKAGETWITRGGWEAKVLRRFNRMMQPLLVIHSEHCPDGEEGCEDHNDDGTFCFDREESGYDLMTRVEVALDQEA